MDLVRIASVKPLRGFKVRLTFINRTQKTLDLEPYLRGPIFAPLRKSKKLFRAVRVDEEIGTIVWPNGADIDPDVLYLGLQPAAWAKKPRRASPRPTTRRSSRVAARA